jgi:mercuric ion transport protein
MTLQYDRPTTGLPITSSPSTTHVRPPVVDNAPPTRSKVMGALAGLACAACCALPLLIAAGVLTGASAAIAQNVLLGVAGLMVAAAGGTWWLHRRNTARKAAAGGSGCAGGNCDC